MADNISTVFPIKLILFMEMLLTCDLRNLNVVFLIGQYAKGTTFLALYNRNRPTPTVFRPVTLSRNSAWLFLVQSVCLERIQDSRRSCSRAVRDGVREAWNKIICLRIYLGTPMHIDNNYIQALKNEVGLAITWHRKENRSLQEQLNSVGILTLYYPCILKPVQLF